MQKLALTIAATALIGFAGSAVADDPPDPQDGCFGSHTVNSAQGLDPGEHGAAVSGSAKNKDVLPNSRSVLVQSLLSNVANDCIPARGSIPNRNNP